MALSGFFAGSLGVTHVQAEDMLLCESFDLDAAAGLVFPASRPGRVCGLPVGAGENAACIDRAGGLPGGAGSGRLLLTQAFNDQVGSVWVATPIVVRERQVRVELDIHIAAGSNPPADGISVVFHAGDVPAELGRGGGALGLAGLPRQFVAVSFDVWDNGEHDPESACDGTGARTCHVEVNHSGDPESLASLASSIDAPDFVRASEAGLPVHASITVNERELVVALATSHADYGSREVLRVLLPAAPFGPMTDAVHAGVTASTGAANAVQAIDNLCVWTAPVVPPLAQWQPLVERGGINCGGPSHQATVDGETIQFAADGAYDEIAAVFPGRSGQPTRFIRRSHGWISSRGLRRTSFDAPISGLADPSLEALFHSEASSSVGLSYRYDVVPGRYEIKIYAAENCPCGLDKDGSPTRRYDVWVQGEAGLSFFSPAEAAARSMSGCQGVLATAVVRTFQADALGGGGSAHLAIEVDDLGGGVPPEDAQLNAFSFRRLGEATGEPLSGDVEDSRPAAPSAYADPEVLLDLDWDDVAAGTRAVDALAGTATVSWRGPGPVFLQFQPIVVGGRLRLADDTRLASAASVLFDLQGAGVFDPLASKLSASFEVFITNAAGKPPADGLVLALVEGSDPAILGTAGGALGLTGIAAAAIGVEIDLWEGGGEGDDSGYNTDGQGHIAVVGSGGGAANVDHVQDQNDLEPELDGAGWVDWLAPAGYRVEVDYSPEARVVVHLTALDGSFPRRRVLDTLVTPFTSHQAMLGFFAATGGETATMEIDNLKVSLAPCDSPAEVARILPDSPVRLSLDEAESVQLALDGSTSTSGGGPSSKGLRYRWRIEGPPGGAELSARCHPGVVATFWQPGDYEVLLEVDDFTCGSAPSATARLAVRVTSGAAPPFLRSDTNCDGAIDISDAVTTLNVLFLGVGAICCDDAADANDDGAIDITDAVVTLNYLFLGGSPPPAPFPQCGHEPAGADSLECAAGPPCP